MLRFSPSPKEMVASIFRNQYLIKKSVQREVVGRYRGSILGIFWSFVNPLFMLAVYTFVFSVIFHARWGGHSSGSKMEFALILFAGLIVFNLFADTIISAPMLILSNTSYVKKVVFPLEVLPVIRLGNNLFHFTISLAVWVVSYLGFVGIPHVTIFYLPIIILPFCFFMLGLSWGLASLGVYLRDISQIVGLLVTAIMFLSPIFYSVEALPEKFRTLLYLNPLTPFIAQARNVMYWGKPPDWDVLAICYLVSFIIAWGGFVWFQLTRKGFPDVV